MKILCILTLLGASAAFTVHSSHRHQHTSLCAVAADVEETFFQAVQLAEAGEKKVDLEELDRLATALEQVDGCQFEEEANLCDKEIQDRLDVAEVLRLQIELQLR